MTSADRFVLAAFLMDYHGGQGSRGYRILCRLNIGGQWSAATMAELRADPFYGHLVEHYADKV